MKRVAMGLRPRLPFGPATLAATALAVVLSQRLPFPGDRGRSPGPSRATVQVPVSGPITPPEPAWLREQAERLELGPAQQKRLNRLETRWIRETHSAQEALTKASEAFAEARPDGGKTVSLRELQERAGPVSLLTGQLLAARRVWWEEASRELSTRQREQAERRWSQRFAKH